MKPLFSHHFVERLPADPELENTPRLVEKACYSLCQPVVPSKPQLIAISDNCAALLGLKAAELTDAPWQSYLVGTEAPDPNKSYAMRYAGHQFGHWAGQLGDGRAINLGEFTNPDGESFAIQLKGAGPTPYSRAGDGFAVLRSSVREFICSEAMHHLLVPTTRALSLATSGDAVARDMFYDGTIEHEPGAIVCRVAPSFIRFGNFQIHATYGEIDSLKQLTDFSIEQFFPDLIRHSGNIDKQTYLAFFDTIQQSTARMIVEWQRVGFVHGVMNTDNMSIHGITIDYGPYGFLDNFDSNWTPNTTDAQQRRYRFGNQASIAHWNLIQLAQALHPLIEDIDALQAVANRFPDYYRNAWQRMMRMKLGLEQAKENDAQLFVALTELLEATETDMTLFYRALAEFNHDLDELDVILADVYYRPNSLNENYLAQRQQWFQAYSERLQHNTTSFQQRKDAMNRVNPLYIPRNYLVQIAIEQAEKGDYRELERLMEAFKQPYTEHSEYADYSKKRPEWAREKAGCSMLSCSS